jgi:hypothetical protein
MGRGREEGEWSLLVKTIENLNKHSKSMVPFQGFFKTRGDACMCTTRGWLHVHHPGLPACAPPQGFSRNQCRSSRKIKIIYWPCRPSCCIVQSWKSRARNVTEKDEEI